MSEDLNDSSTGQRMRVCLKKGRDGPSTLACVRADGSRTWAKVHPFHPVHDLTHCAVESLLGFDRAFFGLIAAGWEIDDFAGPGASGRMPIQALVAEHIVGLLDRDRAREEPLSVEELNDSVLMSLGQDSRVAFKPLTAEQLRDIRALRAQLEGRWRALPPGATLEIGFPAMRAD